MRIAVFGGTGRTGRQVVTQALAAGHEVRVLVRSEDSARRLGRHDRLTAVGGDLRPARTGGGGGQGHRRRDQHPRRHRGGTDHGLH